MILVVPIIMVGLSSNLVYLIPPEQDDKMGFLTTNVLTMFVLLSLIDTTLPSTLNYQDAPLILTIYQTALILFVFQGKGSQS